VSAREGEGWTRLVDVIRRLRRPGDEVFLVGRPNAGKSQLMDMLRGCGKGLENLGKTSTTTVSVFPGTTVGWIKEPLESFQDLFVDDNLSPGKKEFESDGSKIGTESTKITSDKKLLHVVDTPGIFGSAITEQQLTGLMTEAELKMVVPTKALKLDSSFVLYEGRSLFLGGLVRLDMVRGLGNVRIGVAASPLIPIHVCRTDRAKEVYERHVGGEGEHEGCKFRRIMVPPLGGHDRLKVLPPLILAAQIRPSDLYIKETVKKSSKLKSASSKNAKGQYQRRKGNADIIEDGQRISFDVSIGGLGWISIIDAPLDCEFAVYSLGGMGVSCRPSLLKRDLFSKK
jgi:hypothetical protein